MARSTFPSQNVQSTTGSDHLWTLRWWKSAGCCGAKHISKSKCTKHQMSKKCTPLWREAHFEVKNAKKMRGTEHFWTFRFRVAGARDRAPCQKWAKRESFVAVSKNDGRRGTYAEDLARCISRGRRSARDMFIRDVRRSGCWFPEMGPSLEHQTLRFAEVILRDRCSTWKIEEVSWNCCVSKLAVRQTDRQADKQIDR